MSVYTVRISQVVTNGPYAYTIYKDGVGQKDVNSVANIGAAMSGVQTDVGALLTAAGQVASMVTISVTAA
jgi:hypothetical protein